MNDFSDLRASINDTARVARANLLFLLIVGVYLGILVANTTDMSMLKEGVIALPLMQVSVPVVIFYVLAPGLYFFLNANMLLHLYRLSRLTGTLIREITRVDPAQLRHQSNLLFSFDFLQLLWPTHHPAGFRSIVFVAVLATTALLPLGLLLWITAVPQKIRMRRT